MRRCTIRVTMSAVDGEAAINPAHQHVAINLPEPCHWKRLARTSKPLNRACSGLPVLPALAVFRSRTSCDGVIGFIPTKQPVLFIQPCDARSGLPRRPAAITASGPEHGPQAAWQGRAVQLVLRYSRDAHSVHPCCCPMAFCLPARTDRSVA